MVVSNPKTHGEWSFQLEKPEFLLGGTLPDLRSACILIPIGVLHVKLVAVRPSCVFLCMSSLMMAIDDSPIWKKIHVVDRIAHACVYANVSRNIFQHLSSCLSSMSVVVNTATQEC